MSQKINKKLSATLRIYGIGGGGINILRDAVMASKDAGYPEVFKAIVDTSRSNITEAGLLDIDHFIVPSANGAGKNRTFTYAAVQPHINTIMQNCPPKDFNIVIFGASGGTGSVIGPLIMAELFERGCPVMALCIVSTASQKETQNARNTLLTLHNIALKKEIPVVVGLYENGDVNGRQQVDAAIGNGLRALAMLASGKNEELDGMDLINWVMFNKVTAVPAQLCELIIHIPKPDTNIVPLELPVISMASLLNDANSPHLDLQQLYNCVGYVSDEALGATHQTIPDMYFLITNADITQKLENLEAKVKSYTANETRLSGLMLQTAIPDSEDGFVD